MERRTGDDPGVQPATELLAAGGQPEVTPAPRRRSSIRTRETELTWTTSLARRAAGSEQRREGNSGAEGGGWQRVHNPWLDFGDGRTARVGASTAAGGLRPEGGHTELDHHAPAAGSRYDRGRDDSTGATMERRTGGGSGCTTRNRPLAAGEQPVVTPPAVGALFGGKFY